MAAHKKITFEGTNYRLVPEEEWALHWGKRRSFAKTPEPKKARSDHEQAFHMWKVATYRGWKKEHESAADYLGLTKMNADDITRQMKKEWNSMLSDMEAGVLAKAKVADVQKYIDASRVKSNGGDVLLCGGNTIVIGVPDNDLVGTTTRPDADIVMTMKKLEAELNVTRNMLDRDIESEEWYIKYIQTEQPDKPWRKGQPGQRPNWVTAGLLGLTPTELSSKRRTLAKFKCAMSPGAFASDASDQGRVEDVDEEDDEQVKEEVKEDVTTPFTGEVAKDQESDNATEVKEEINVKKPNKAMTAIPEAD